MVKYPEIEVDLVGQDGNAFTIIGSISKALSRGGVSLEEVYKFQEEATDGDYYHVLKTCMKWVTCN